MISAEQLHKLAPQCNAEAWAPALLEAAERFDIDTPLRIAHWLGQQVHESSGFTRLRENLNYSAERLMQVWPRRFPTLADAQSCAHNPEALANRVYGGRLGNVQPGDGAKFLGRGPIQLTGRDNVTAAEHATGIPYTSDPSLLEQPHGGAMAAGWFWSSRGLNELADHDNLEAITRTINGGLVGLEDRRAQVAKAKVIWGA